MTQALKSEKLTIAKELLYVGAFSVLAIYTPYVVHFLGGANAGKIWLPMPFFVLLAGIALGWRAGMATAIVSPLVSYLISGMPVLSILPFITIQLAVLGTVAGFLGKNIIYPSLFLRL